MSESLVNRFDHIEIATANIKKLSELFGVFGFSSAQKKVDGSGESLLLLQGHSRVLLTQGKAGSFAHEYVQKHGDGVCSLAFTVPSSKIAFETALNRGAVAAVAPAEESYSTRSGKPALRVLSSIQSFGDVRATFVERSQAAFDVHEIFGRGFESTEVHSGLDVGLAVVDHLTNNVEMGQMERWADFYKKVYGFVEARYFDIKAAKTGLHSKVLQSVDGAVKIPVNEATEKASQVQEFVDQHRGAGVQHIAFTTNDIVKTVEKLRSRGVEFLEIPDTYYEAVPNRLKQVTESLSVLQKNKILVDGDDKGYLLQIFTKNQIGPLFFEIIQRKGHNGFGEGNFQALFEAIEADQMRRGVLS
jgi:4-hydroxyphenylpyruvate dioxygenase